MPQLMTPEHMTTVGPAPEDVYKIAKFSQADANMPPPGSNVPPPKPSPAEHR
ncbi:hypothetical protein DOY81_013576, partial [Sarcophaga bullata]